MDFVSLLIFRCGFVAAWFRWICKLHFLIMLYLCFVFASFIDQTALKEGHGRIKQQQSRWDCSASREGNDTPRGISWQGRI